MKGGDSYCITIKKGEHIKDKLYDSSFNKKSTRRTKDGQDIYIYRKRKEKMKGGNMKEIAGINMTIEASTDKVWEVIASIGGVDKWVPAIITSCRVEGSGAGAKRFCTMGNGARLSEVIDEVDNSAKRFRYRVTDGLPVKSYEGTIIVKPSEGDNSEITWYGIFDASEKDADDFRRMLREVYMTCIKGLEKYCRN